MTSSSNETDSVATTKHIPTPLHRRRPRVLIIIALVPVIGIALLLIWGTARSGSQPSGIFVNANSGEVKTDNTIAPEFSVTTFTNRKITLSNLRGNIVMIDFWASWCPPCRRESSELTAVYKMFENHDVEFIGIDVWDDESAGRRFIAEEGITYPNAMDHNGFITINYGVTGIPEKFFIDRDGHIVRKYIGPISAEELSKIINELLGKS